MTTEVTAHVVALLATGPGGRTYKIPIRLIGWRRNWKELDGEALDTWEFVACLDSGFEDYRRVGIDPHDVTGVYDLGRASAHTLLEWRSRLEKLDPEGTPS